MKMSLSPESGMQHVRGGLVLRVADAHPVPTRQGKHKYVHAEVGSLVIEVCDARTREILGWSYLDGKAHGLFSGGIGSPAKGKMETRELARPVYRFDFPQQHQASGDDIVEEFYEIRHGELKNALVAFQITVPEREDEWRDAIYQMWKSAASSNGHPRSGTHLLGVVRRASDETAAATMSTLDSHVTPFQVGLLLSTWDLKPYEVSW